MGKEWIKNTGEMPVTPETKVDTVFDDNFDDPETGDLAGHWYWGLEGGITHWRLHQEIDADGFIVWNGGECPVSEGTKVIYKMRDGSGSEHPEYAEQLRWNHEGEGSRRADIIGYKVSQAAYPVDTRIDFSEESNVKDTNPKDMVGTRKAPLSTVPMNVIAEVGVAMLEGASKYGRHNYRGVGVRGSVYFDATMRHLISWWEGEDIDPDSQMSHITKAITSLVVLRDAMMQGKCTDDRPPRSVPFYGPLNGLAGEIIDKHSDKAPKHYTIEEV